MLSEHDRVVLTPVLSERLMEVDVGTIVHVYGASKALEVEFVMRNGRTASVVTVERFQVRPVRPDEITHARQRALHD
jgi:Domain of unknown function (DUF4926)